VIANKSYPGWQLGLLFATGIFAGFVDSIAGGGGLITLPVLLSFGGDPRHVLGANKLQATCGSASAAWHYSQAKTVPWRDCVRGFLITIIGAAIGTWTVLRLDPSFLKRAIPVLLIVVAIGVLLRPELGRLDVPPRVRRHWFDLIFGLGLGFYDGFFGPGVGTFWTMAFVMALGFNLTKATGYTKVMNLASNLTSLTFFAASGEVYYAAGISMGMGQFLGARIGSRLVIKRGTKFIRPVFIVIVLAVTVRLLTAK
jgi:uncharacterized protein